MKITILAFGQIAEIAAQSCWDMPYVADTDTLQSLLLQQYPALQSVRFTFAVNHQAVTNNTNLTDNSIVALLPPIAGG